MGYPLKRSFGLRPAIIKHLHVGWMSAGTPPMSAIGTKRTKSAVGKMSANDPKRTFAAAEMGGAATSMSQLGPSVAVHSRQIVIAIHYGYYVLARTSKDLSSLLAVSQRSYVNRAVAFYRHFIGIPTDLDPPLAP